MTNQVKIRFPETGIFAMLRDDGICSLWQEGILHNAFVDSFVIDNKEYSVIIDRQGVTIHCITDNLSVEYSFKQEFKYNQEPMFTYLKHSWRHININF